LCRAADDQQANVVPVNDRKFLAKILPQQSHQKVNFRLRPAPILERECIEGQVGYFEPGAGFDHFARHLHPGAVSCDPGQVAAFRPSAIAIHNDSQMLRQAFQVELFEETCFLGVGGFQQLNGFHQDSLGGRRARKKLAQAKKWCNRATNGGFPSNIHVPRPGVGWKIVA
jgi:hypothetical protein